MQSYFQERVAFFTARTILAAVMEAPDGIFTESFCPVIRSLTFVPPTSITRMLRGLAFARGVFNGVTSWEQSRKYIRGMWIVNGGVELERVRRLKEGRIGLAFSRILYTIPVL